VTTVSQLPASCNLVCTVGNDFTLTLAVTENGSTWSSTGATLATDIIARDGTVVATDFTTAATDGQVTLTLTDANTTALGVGVYSYRLSVTKSGNTRDWIAGTLSVVEAGIGGTSTSNASLAISSGALSLALTTFTNVASAVTVADAGSYFTGTNVEAVLQELGSTSPTLDELIATGGMFSYTGGTSSTNPIMIAPFALRIVACELVCFSTSVSASDTNWWSFELRKYNATTGTSGSTFATKTTKVTGGEAIAQRQAWNFDTVSFDSGISTFAKGDALGLAGITNGTPGNATQVAVTVRYRPV